MGRVNQLLAKPALDRDNLKRTYHGKECGPCPNPVCQTPVYNCTPEGELHCAGCGSGELNNITASHPRLAERYPMRFTVVVFQGRNMLCEWDEAIKWADKIRAKEQSGTTDEQAKLDAIREKNKQILATRAEQRQRRDRF